ncbi:MAG: IS21 family transposase [Candidatus Acidiferrales bacterium]|jgi:transposase
MKSARERMDLYAAYQEVGTYRAAAQICGTTHKTVKRAVAKARAAEATPPGAEGVIAHNYDDVSAVIAKRVDRTEGRITAKRLLPVVRAAGYEGSARNLRRAVADAKAKWRVDHHRGRRPGVWVPGDMLVFDWGEIGPLFVFCAVLAWSRFRFVSFSDNLGADATMAALAQCMETIGGVPKTLLTDRMGCLKAGTVAGIVIPTPDYVRFVTHYGTRPDFCCGADPASKGIVENLVGYVKSDLMIPQELSVSELPRANTLGAAWCTEVNGVLHSDIAAVPAERLEIERPLLCDLPSLRARIGRVVLRKVDRLSCVRFGSARYSVPTAHIGRTVELRVADGVVVVVFLGEIIATHSLVAPGETAICDDHYGGPRSAPARAVRAKTAAEVAFCALGPVAEAFIKGAAARGVTTLAADLVELCALEAAHDKTAFVAAIERAVQFGRFRAHDVRSILAAGTGVPRPRKPGEALIVDLPSVATRPLGDYAIGGVT